MYTFKCVECNDEFEKKRPTSCRDGMHRCAKCQDNIKSLKYRLTPKGKINHRKTIARYRKTEKGRKVRRASFRKHRARNLEWYRLKSRAWNHGLKAKDLVKLFCDQPICQICGTSKHLSVDHMIPQSRGGTNDKNNLQALCLNCNVFKGDKVFLADGSGYLVESA